MESPTPLDEIWSNAQATAEQNPSPSVWNEIIAFPPQLSALLSEGTWEEVQQFLALMAARCKQFARDGDPALSGLRTMLGKDMPG